MFTLNVSAANQSNWDHFSDYATLTLTASSLALPIYDKDIDGIKASSYSIGSAWGISFLGKSLITEPRPDHSGYDSFPSGHTAIAFASASNLYIRYGWQKGIPAYGLASLVALGRVEENKHYWKDVIAGAAIGSVSSYLFTTPLNNKITFVPWLDKNQAGLSISMPW